MHCFCKIGSSSSSSSSDSSSDNSEVGLPSRRHVASPVSNEGGNEANVVNEAPLVYASSKQTRKRPLAPLENQDLHTLSWISKALSHIHSADGLVTSRDEAESSHALYSPNICLPYLRKLRSAAMTLFIHTDNAMLDAQTKHYYMQQKIYEEKLSAVTTELAHSKEQSQAELNKLAALLQQGRKDSFKQAALLKQEKTKSQKQSTLFSKEKAALTSSYKSERDALIDQHARTLQRQLEEEREKSFCCICHDKHQDTIILPCLHFQYCLSCLLRHREANSNTCPSCKGPIEGLLSCFTMKDGESQQKMTQFTKQTCVEDG